ncbi:MAG: hypothetical protein ABWW66_06565 [Archaeoglobaceae archaeon]
MQKRFQFFTGFKQLIEQKNILIRCFREENTDSIKLRFPKDFTRSFVNYFYRRYFNFIKISVTSAGYDNITKILNPKNKTEIIIKDPVKEPGIFQTSFRSEGRLRSSKRNYSEKYFWLIDALGSSGNPVGDLESVLQDVVQLSEVSLRLKWTCPPSS